MAKDMSFDELAKCKVSKNRSVVISQCSKGGFTIAQQLSIVDDDKICSVFLKGAIAVADYDKLVGLRDALNTAIDKVSQDIEEDWDSLDD